MRLLLSGRIIADGAIAGDFLEGTVALDPPFAVELVVWAAAVLDDSQLTVWEHRLEISAKRFVAGSAPFRVALPRLWTSSDPGPIASIQWSAQATQQEGSPKSVSPKVHFEVRPATVSDERQGNLGLATPARIPLLDVADEVSLEGRCELASGLCVWNADEVRLGDVVIGADELSTVQVSRSRAASESEPNGVGGPLDCLHVVVRGAGASIRLYSHIEESASGGLNGLPWQERSGDVIGLDGLRSFWANLRAHDVVVSSWVSDGYVPVRIEADDDAQWERLVAELARSQSAWSSHHQIAKRERQRALRKPGTLVDLSRIGRRARLFSALSLFISLAACIGFFIVGRGPHAMFFVSVCVFAGGFGIVPFVSAIRGSKSLSGFANAIIVPRVVALGETFDCELSLDAGHEHYTEMRWELRFFESVDGRLGESTVVEEGELDRQAHQVDRAGDAVLIWPVTVPRNAPPTSFGVLSRRWSVTVMVGPDRLAKRNALGHVVEKGVRSQRLAAQIHVAPLSLE